MSSNAKFFTLSLSGDENDLGRSYINKKLNQNYSLEPLDKAQINCTDVIDNTKINNLSIFYV